MKGQRNKSPGKFNGGVSWVDQEADQEKVVEKVVEKRKRKSKSEESCE